jgi:predicted nucleic acid-binding protein
MSLSDFLLADLRRSLDRPTRAEEALADLATLPLERYSHRLVLARAWRLRANLTLYDAAYVALAELLDAPLVTCDAALARAPHSAKVEVLGGG